MANEEEILKARILAGKEAGKKIREIYDKGFSVSYKEDSSPVTDADLASNGIIRKTLSRFSTIGWLSEESKDDLSRLKRKGVFIVDPLDGTEDFLRKDGSFSLNIAYVEEGKPVLSFIGYPAKAGYAFAAKGKGAFFVNEEGKIRRLSVSSRTKQLVRLVSKTHLLPSEEEIREKNKDRIASSLSRGASLKGIALAKGEGDFSIRYTKHTKEWDVCARDLLVKEAGGIFLDGKGKEFSYNREDVYNHDGYERFNRKENRDLKR